MSTKLNNLSFLRRLFYYQKERFPILLLLISIFPVSLSTNVIAIGNFSLVHFLGVLFVSLLYLFHIRLIDERRDFIHDSKFHRDRPIQMGVISLEQLRTLDILAIFLIIIITTYLNVSALPILALLLIYSYLSEKEFLSKSLRAHFFIYNAVNIFQMFLLQLLSYYLFYQSFRFTTVSLLHFSFIIFGTITFEIGRKIYAPGNDGTGKDTYSFHLGFENILTIFLILSQLTLFFWIAILISLNKGFILVVPSSLLFITLLFAILEYSKNKNEKIKNVFQLVFIGQYTLSHYIIFFTLAKII